MLIELAYLVCLTIIEILGVGIGPVVALVLHAGLILALFAIYLFKRDSAGQPLWLGLVLVSVLRIASLTLPLRLIHPLVWAAVICLPVWLGIGLLRPHLQLSRADLGLRKAKLGWQILIALSGAPIGYLGSLMLHPQPYFREFSWLGLLLGGSLLLVSIAFTEELLFRGLLLHLAQRSPGAFALPFISAVYAAMYIATRSPGYLIWMGLVGWFWGWCVQKTGSVWGVAVAHGLMLLGLGFVWPYLN
jgi:membrane protease YdiL (CAAX protease family)